MKAFGFSNFQIIMIILYSFKTKYTTTYIPTQFFPKTQKYNIPILSSINYNDYYK